MMRVFWEEWREGGQFSFLRLLPALAAVVAAFLVVTLFQPGALFEALAAMGLFGGVLSGTQRWNRVPAWGWVGTEKVRPLAYAAGKVSGFLLILVIWAASALPPLLLVSLSWGLPWEVVTTSLAWVLAGALAAQGVGHVVTWGQSDFPRLVAAVLVLSWLIASLQHPLSRGLNPLWQIWNLFRDPQVGCDFGSLGLLLGLTALLWGVVVVGLEWRERQK